MGRGATPDPTPGPARSAPATVSRRGLLASAAVVAAAPLLASCDGGGGGSGPGTTSRNDLSKVLPGYVPNQAIKPDIPGTAGAQGAVSDPAFLRYPASPIRTVPGSVGSGGSYVTMTPLWGSIPPSSGNGYYEAVNKALGATLKMQPADGTTYANALPPLFAADKLPDWINIPAWTNATLSLGEAVGVKFADLTPYLAGDKIKQYPNLANVPANAWVSGVWNGKLYGIPVYPSGSVFTGTHFYRRDIFDKRGVSPDLKNADDLFDLGRQLTDAAAGRWAFDDLFGDDGAYIGLIFGIPATGKWIDSGGKLQHRYELPAMAEALAWHAKLVKAGYVHPDAVANNSQNAKQRFWSGKVAVCADGTGAWNGDDAKSGTAANPDYRRQAFKPFSASGGKPAVELNPGAGMFSYLNKRLSDKQIRECLAIANYLAAPYGSVEWLTVNFGTPGAQYTMVEGNPVLTELGSKEVATTFQFLACPPAATTVMSGFPQVARDYAAWQAEAVQHAYKPLFYGMNITEPPQYASIGQAVKDTMADVRLGRKPVSAYTDAVAAWRKQGGDALRTFYDGIRDKYGTGQ